MKINKKETDYVKSCIGWEGSVPNYNWRVNNTHIKGNADFGEGTIEGWVRSLKERNSHS